MTTGEAAPPGVDIRQVLRTNYRRIAGRLVLRLGTVALLVTAGVTVGRTWEDGDLLMIPCAPAAMFLFLFTGMRLGSGVRIMQCAKILRHYPLQYRERVVVKDKEWALQSTVYTVRLSDHGEQNPVSQWAIDAAGSRSWPEGTANGVWYAGDPPFGGVLIVPGSNAMMYLNPADWEKHEKKRREAGPERLAAAEAAGIATRNWRKPKTT